MSKTKILAGAPIPDYPALLQQNFGVTVHLKDLDGRMWRENVNPQDEVPVTRLLLAADGTAWN